MPFRKCVIFSCVIAPLESIANYDYENKNSGLSSAPTGIPSDSLSVDLTGNALEEVAWIESLPKLERVVLDRNKLASFPDMRNVSESLKARQLYKNVISIVDKVFLEN